MPADRGTKVKVWSNPSHSTPGKNYETIQWSNGNLTCNCRGWIYPKNGNPRTCTHVRRAEIDLWEQSDAPVLKEVVRRNRPNIGERIRKQRTLSPGYKREQKEYETNERMYVPPFEPVPFKKYKRLIRIDTEA